jgi:hypothetical protein
LQAKERGAASAGASSVMIKSKFTRSEFVVLSSDHSKSRALSPLLSIKYREEIVAELDETGHYKPRRSASSVVACNVQFHKLPQHAVVSCCKQRKSSSSYGEPRKCSGQEIIRRMELLLENQMRLQEQYSQSQRRRN